MLSRVSSSKKLARIEHEICVQCNAGSLLLNIFPRSDVLGIPQVLFSIRRKPEIHTRNMRTGLEVVGTWNSGLYQYHVTLLK